MSMILHQRSIQTSIENNKQVLLGYNNATNGSDTELSKLHLH